MKNSKPKTSATYRLSNGMQICLSFENSKMGKVSSFSVLPVATCAPGVPCCKDCYACKMMALRPSNRVSWERNMRAVEACGLEVAEKIAPKIKTQLFRWNVAGDLRLAGYWDVMCHLAELRPDVQFFAFTKCHEFLELRPDVQFFAFTKCHEFLELPRPANFNLIASVWNDFRPAGDPGKYPEAHFCDGSRPMPEHAVECSGQCETCAKCAFLKAGEAVYFVKH